MKQIFGFCIALALCVFSGIGVYAVDAPPALRWEGTYNKQPFYVTARPGQTTMLDLNLPLGGHFAYNQQQAVTYIQPPESQQVFRVPARLQTNLAEAHFEKVGPGPALAGYPSTQWRLIVNRKLCAEIYASQQAGKDWGVNLSDVTNVMQALTDLHDIHDSLGCLRFAVPAALGRMIGLPLQVRGGFGEWVINRVSASKEDPNVLPDALLAQAKPLTDAVRLQYVQAQILPQSLAAFKNAVMGKNLPLAMQLKTLGTLWRRQDAEQDKP